MKDTFKAKRIQVLFDHVLLTANRYEEDNIKDGVIDTNAQRGRIKEYQKVVSVGPNCHAGIHVGDVVVVNFQNYARPVHSLNRNSVLDTNKDSVEMVIDVPVILVDDKEYLFIYDREIDMIVTDYSGEL